MGSLREEYERRWVSGRDFNKSNATLRQQLDMDQDQRRAYLEWEQQTNEQNRLKTQAETQSKIFGNYADKYNSFLDQLKSFDQNAGGTLRAGTGGYYHSPDAYNSTLSELDKLKNTGEYLKYPWSLVQSADPDNASGLPSPTEITRYVADMTDLAESQRDYYGQYKSPGQYYSRPMVPEVTQREPEGPINPDWRQDYLKPDAKLPEGTQSIAKGGKLGSDVKYTNWTQPQLSDDEQKAQLARGEEYSQYASGVPDNAKPAWQVTGTAGISLYKPDAFMEREIAYKKWKDNENSPYKTPVYVDVLKSSGQWETMPAAQRITAMKLGYQDEAKKYGKQIDGLGLRDRDGRVADITLALDYESLTQEKQRALEEERTALLSGDLEETYSDLEFRRAGAEKLAKKYETIEGWQKFDQKYQYVWNNADFVDLSGYDANKLGEQISGMDVPSPEGRRAEIDYQLQYGALEPDEQRKLEAERALLVSGDDANKLKPENPASQYYEYLNAGPERKRELESATTVPVFSLSGFMSPTVMESNIRLKGIDELDADEILVFNYLYNKKGADAAMEYLDGKGTELLSRRALTRQQRMEEMTENSLELASLATLYWQMENAVTGPVQFVAGMLGVDPNDPIFDRQSDVVTVRSKAGQVLDQVYGNAMIPILNVPVASTLYNAGMSAGDSLIGRALGAVVGYQGLNRLMMTSRVLGSGMQNSLKEGDSIGMSVFRGLSAAIIENVTESLGDKAFYGNPRSVALYLAQNFFAEGSEEFLANLGNTMVELAAKGTESEIYHKALDAAHKRGWSRETAQSFAFKEWLREAGTDFLTGSLMGLMSGVAGAPGQQSRINQVKINEAYDAIMADEGIKYSPKDKFSLYIGELLQGDTPTTIESVLAPTNTRTEGYDRAEQATTPYTQAQRQRDIALSRLGKTTQGDVGTQMANASVLDQAVTWSNEQRLAALAEQESELEMRLAYGDKLNEAQAGLDSAQEGYAQAGESLDSIAIELAELRQRLDDLKALQNAELESPEATQEIDRAESKMAEIQTLLDRSTPTEQLPGAKAEAEAAEPVSKQAALQTQLDTAEPVEQVPGQAPETGTADDRRTRLESQGIAAGSVEQFRQELESVDPESPDALERIAEIQKRMDMAGIKRAEEAQIPYHGRDISYKRENIPDIQEHRAKNPDLNDEAFDFAAEAAYGAGLSGSKTLFEVSAAIKDLAPETAKALFDAGLGVYNAKVGERHALRQRMKDYMPKPGQGKLIIPKEVIQKMNPEQKKLAADLQKFIIMAGVEGELFASETADESGRILGEEGSFDPSTGRFRFDINAGINFVAELKNKARGAVEFALPRVMGHEFTHYLKTTAPELYAVYQDAVIKELAKKESVDDLVMQELGRARKGALTYAEALEEVVARASEMMLRDSEALPAVMAENPTLWEKFKAWVSEFVNNIRERMKGMNPAYVGAKSLIETGNGIVKYAGNLQTLWDRAMADSIRYRMDAPAKPKTAPISPVGVVKDETLASLADGQKAANIAGNEGAAWAGGEQMKFSAREPVEEVGNLVAVHNLSESQLQETVRLGGFAMPSIAVLKAGTEHSRYGDISVVFGKETIDPVRDPRNKIYGGDAYTPSFPQINYEISGDNTAAVREKVSELLGELYKPFAIQISDDSIKRAADNNRGSFADAYENEPGLMGAYLKSIGEDFIPHSSEPEYAPWSGIGNQAIKYLADKMGRELQAAYNKPFDEKMAMEPAIRGVINEYFEQQYSDTLSKKQIKEMGAEEYGFNKIDEIIRGVGEYLKTKGAVRFDKYETGKMLRDRFEQDNHLPAYRAWLNELFAGAIAKSGIRNNADIFTPSGNRRSFDATHWAVTLENIVRAMKAENSKGADGWASSNLFGVATKNFKSIADVRRDADRLRQMDDEAYKAEKDEFQERLVELASEIATKKEPNRFIAIDRAAEALTDAARAGTKAGMQRILNEYRDYHNIKADTAEKLDALIKDIMKMPTEYFEAKPERAVGLEEMRAVIHPNTTSKSLIDWMERKGVRRLEYEAGNEQDRLDKLNSVEDVRFSVRDTEYLAAVESGDMETAQKMVDEAAREAGYTIKAYHGTKTRFNVFRWGDIGYHFGTKSQARHRSGYGADAVMIPAYLKLDNPLVIDTDYGSWESDYAGRRMVQDGHITQQEYDSAMVANTNKRDETLRNILRDKGYDGIQYKNFYEGNSTKPSYIVFDPTQIKRADAITRDTTGVVIPLSERFKDSSQDIRYSARDNTGRALSQEQQEYFKDSKVRDEQGRLLKVYHGTDAKFTEFNTKLDPQFFTASKEYAGSYGKNIMPVYLNIANPFDTRNPDALAVFNDAFKEYAKERFGKNIAAYDAGSMVSFIDADTLYPFLRKMKRDGKLNYDGIVISEGVSTDGYGISYVPLSGNQVKRVDNLTPTSSPDIRYAERDPENSLPSARAILGGAFGEVAQTGAEKKRVAEYRKSADRYNRLENELNNLLEKRKQLYRDKAPQSEKNELRADINALRDKLDKADRVLLNLQMSQPLRDVVAREVDKAYGAYQEKAAERVAQARQGMRDTGVRGKIRNVYLRLMKALANPTEKQYVPAQYVRPLIDIAEAIDVSGKSVNLAEKIAKFKERYEALKTDTDYSLSSEFDESILNEIKALQKEIGATLPINLKGEQLERLYKVLRAVETTLMNARKLIASNIAKTNYEAAEQIIGEVRAAKGVGFSRLSNFLLRFTTGMLDARRAARLLTGYAENGMLERLIAHLNEGQLMKNNFIMQGSRLFDFLTAGKENAAQLRNFTGREAKWIATGIKDAQGHELKITPAMRASLYMHTLNDDNLRHLLGGGITMPAIDLYKQGRFVEAFKRGNTFRLTEDQIKKILAGMTAYEKAWVKAAQAFFAYSTEKINETSMQLVGYKKAMVQNYFPIQSDHNFLRVDFESIARDGSIEGMGFLKERVGSTNPMYLMDITSVLDRQLNNTAKYVGLAIPVRNFNKVYRVSAKGYVDSVQKALNQMWGDKATKYLENLMADIQDARKNPPTFFDKAKGRFAQSVLALNPSVSLKQAASYPTAAAVLGWKPLMKALGRGGKKGTPLSRADQELIAKYTPLLWMRTKGMSTTELGDIRAMKPEFGAISKLSEAAHKYLLNWIQQIDTATVGRLWYAAQYNIDAARPDLEKGSDAYYQEVAKLFNRAVEETQPDYTVMQRPDILRNPNAVIRGMTMFMTQRLQNFGILYDAAGELMETGRKLKADPNNEALKSQRERAGQQLNRAVFSQAVSALVLSLMTLLGKAVLHRPDEYRDEDNQLVLGSIVEQVARDVPSILLGMVVGGAEMYETALSLLTGKRSYGLQFSPIEFINDLKTSFDNLLMEVNKTVAEGKDPKRLIDSASKVAMQALTFLGMPVNNAKKIVDGVYLHYKDFEDGAFGSFKAGKAGIDKRTAYANFVEAFTAGDQVRMDLLMKELQDAEVTESGIKSGIRAAIKANFEAGKINRETYIQQVVDATDYDDVKNDIIKQWFTAGEIDEAEAKRLLQKFTADDEPTEQFKTLERWKHEPENDEDSYKVLNKFLDAVRTGKNLRAVVTEYTDPNKYAYDSKYLAGQITTAFKQEYIDNPAQRSKLKGYLLNAYSLLGYDRKERSGEIDRWLMKYDSADFENAIATGVNLKAVIDEKIKYSTAKNPKGVIISQVTATFADQYKKMSPGERARIKPRLIDAYVMLGYDRAYSSKKIDKWLTD